MSAPRPAFSGLAPLQRVMLGDSLADETAGHHVEQVEIRFAEGPCRSRVDSAWAETVAQTEALRIAFSIENGEPGGIETALPRPVLDSRNVLAGDWSKGLAADRCVPLIAPRQVPWRAVYRPHDGRFVWTFHHALLDGRSITRILRAFLARVSGTGSESLALSHWHPPDSAAIALAAKMFREDFPLLRLGRGLPTGPDHGPAVRILGADFRSRLQAAAHAMESTPATLIIWAWGQALAIASGTQATVVEQVRSGAPQKNTAGFTMVTLPVCIPLALRGGEETALRDFRRHLLDLRAIEGVSPADFPVGIHPDMDHAASSVIMVEQATPAHLLRTDFVRSLILHEAEGESLMAIAYILPDLRLEVGGPGRRVLLDDWAEALKKLVK